MLSISLSDLSIATEGSKEGNAFEGPIPAFFSNLTSLTDRERIIDPSNGSSSSFDFVRNMKSLSKLVLQNNINISSSIPSNIGEYRSLSLLDLRFNSLAEHFSTDSPAIRELKDFDIKEAGKGPSQLFKGNLKLRSLKIILRYISSALEKGPVVYLYKAYGPSISAISAS
ncbi:hypothetical protein CQW23_15043 [Capsicum baccatum]|uniref:LRR receptor-like serine/threonine-protein kinase n=1 Tax=Capsicum baccatum TaxID=33114 RepID=A0A2G2WKW2_CAPBA|nr:hypothetical protein CQW23_15043 [Capsicum baccatum]